MCIGGMSEWEKRHLFDENIWPISACLAPSFMLSTKWQIQKIYIRVPDFVDLRASGCKCHVRGSLPLRCGHKHSHLLMDTRRWSLDFRHACVLSHVWLFETLWTVECQTPLWWDFPGKNTGVGCHFLSQWIFLMQSNLCLLLLLHW